MHYTVCGGMLGADVHDVVLLSEDSHSLFDQRPIFSFHDAGCHVDDLAADHGLRIQLGIVNVVFTEGETPPMIVQQETTHVGIVDKTNAEQGVYFPFVQMSCPVKVGDRIKERIVAVGHGGNDNHLLRKVDR